MAHSPAAVRHASLGSINLLEASDISEWDGKPFGFTIVCPQRTYYIIAASEDDRYVCGAMDAYVCGVNRASQ